MLWQETKEVQSSKAKRDCIFHPVDPKCVFCAHGQICVIILLGKMFIYSMQSKPAWGEDARVKCKAEKKTCQLQVLSPQIFVAKLLGKFPVQYSRPFLSKIVASIHSIFRDIGNLLRPCFPNRNLSLND